jgi:hypothetical protein
MLARPRHTGDLQREQHGEREVQDRRPGSGPLYRADRATVGAAPARGLGLPRDEPRRRHHRRR